MTLPSPSHAQVGPEDLLEESDAGHAPRLRTAGFGFERRPSGQAVAEVTLEWHDGRRFVGRAEGVSSAWADARMCAEATLRAIAEFTNHESTFDLVGVKTLRAFDANIVMVCVLGRRDGKPLQLLGCRIAEGDLLRSAVLATLHATNRVLARWGA